MKYRIRRFGHDGEVIAIVEVDPETGLDMVYDPGRVYLTEAEAEEILGRPLGRYEEVELSVPPTEGQKLGLERPPGRVCKHEEWTWHTLRRGSVAVCKACGDALDIEDDGDVNLW